jgi:hypothetical protein
MKTMPTTKAWCNSLMDEHLPAGATEQHLIEELASIIWRKRRVLQAEGASINRRLAQPESRRAPAIDRHSGRGAVRGWACQAKNTDIRKLDGFEVAGQYAAERPSENATTGH